MGPLAIDPDHLARATAGDAALELELLVLFRAQLAAAAADLGRAAAMSGSERVALLHRLRGAARAVGAQPLAATLAAAEAGLDADPSIGLAEPAFVALHAMLASTTEAADRLIAARRQAGLAKAGESG